MSYIEVEEVVKDYKIKKRNSEQSRVRQLLFPEYELKRAVDHISFSVEAGEIVGYLGPNGAGKSTTIKMLSGILVPTEGNIRVGKWNPGSDRRYYVKEIGVVFGQRTQLWWDIPVRDSLILLKEMYRVSDVVYKENMNFFSDILDMNAILDIPVRQLSLGQRMRADLCAALIHNPSVIFLDEPTIGLDAVAKKKIREFIKYINITKKATVLLTTHDMSDVEKLCDRVIVIDKGKKVFDDSLRKLMDHYGYMENVCIETLNTFIHQELLEEKEVSLNRINETQIEIRYDKRKIRFMDILELISVNNKIVSVNLQNAELEDAIRYLYMSEKEEVYEMHNQDYNEFI